MKNALFTFVIIVSCTPLLLSCASQNDVKKLNYQLRVVNKKVDDMKVSTVGKMQEKQAASSSQLDELRRQILVIEGKIEETLHLNRQLREQNKELENSLQTQTTRLEENNIQQLTDYQNRIRKLEEQMVSMESASQKQHLILSSMQQARIERAQQRATAAAKAADDARAKAEASKKVLRTSSNGVMNIASERRKKIFTSKKPSSLSPRNTPVAQIPTKTATTSPPQEDILTSAEDAYASGNYQKALSLFESYADKKPANAKTVTARFMMGECLFQKREYDQAILQYQKVISNNPAHPRASSALLKQGMAFENLSDAETAKIIYKKILTSYASSPEADSARDRSAKL